MVELGWLKKWKAACQRWMAGAFVTLLVLPALGQSLEQQLVADGRDGRLDDFDLLSAALIASGVDQDWELEAWHDSYVIEREAIVAGLRTQSLAGKLETLNAALHRNILRGAYRREATDIRGALSAGNYNCLSAAALLLDLCQACDLEPEIWLSPGHVRLRMRGASTVFLEPGIADADLENGQEHAAELERQIQPVQLIAKFYYNRGVAHIQQRQFAQGLALVQTGLQLDPADNDARVNLAAGYNNWAAAQCESRCYEHAAKMIEAGLAVEPAFAPLLANERLVRAKRGE